MTSENLLLIIIAITTIGYAFDQLLDYINLRHQRADIPDDVASFFDRTKYLKALDYHRELTRFSFVTSGVGFAAALGMLVFGGFGLLDQFLTAKIDHHILRALVFFGTLMLAGDLLTLPFQLYSTFVIEEKYGFNKTTVKLFFLDKLKGYMLAAVIGGALISTLLYLIDWLGNEFWIWFAVVACVFILIVNMFYTSWILPLFNKLTPLPEGVLKDAIKSFSKKVEFPLDNIYVIDGSKRSSKANAFFSGIGRKKKIVLYDTLINNHSIEELVAVLAHEVGHFKKKHIILTFALSALQIILTLFILSLMVYNSELSLALGGDQLSIPLNLLAFGILYSPISSVTALLMNLLSRKNEFEADAYAAQTYDGSALAQALKKLSVDNLSNLYPHPWYVFFHYSHPPLLTRLAAIEAKTGDLSRKKS
jgi:STE24 endopeptidase